MGAAGAWHLPKFWTSPLAPADFEVLDTNWHPQSLFYVISGTLSFKFLPQALFYIMTLLAAHLALTLHDDIQKINKYVAVWLKNSMAVSENPNKDILCITTTWYKPDVLIGLSFFWLTWLCTAAVFHFTKAHSFIIALLARAKLISEMVGY